MTVDYLLKSKSTSRCWLVLISPHSFFTLLYSMLSVAHLMTCMEGKNGLWSLSQPMKALVLCDSAVSSSGSIYCEERATVRFSSSGRRMQWVKLKLYCVTNMPASRQFVRKSWCTDTSLRLKGGVKNDHCMRKLFFLSVNAATWSFLPGYQARQHSWEHPGLVWGSWGGSYVRSTDISPFRTE